MSATNLIATSAQSITDLTIIPPLNSPLQPCPLTRVVVPLLFKAPFASTNEVSNSSSNDTLLTFEKSRHYIETLYLQTNLHDHYNNMFVVNNDISDNVKHSIMLGWLYDNVLSKGEFIGTSTGRDWYRLDNYKIGVIVDYDEAKKSNWYTVLIQYFQSHMWTLQSDLKGLDLPLSGDSSLYNIQRADVALVYQSDTDYLTEYGVISKFREFDQRGKGSVVETKYLGGRKSGNMVRWYNKSIEMEAKEDYTKIDLFAKYFGNVKNLYTLELEMKRKYLKGTMGIDTLEDISKLKDAYDNIVGGMRVYKDTEENRRMRKQGNGKRIEALRFAEFKDYERLQQKSYEPSSEYLVDKMFKSATKYADAMKLTGEERKVKLLAIVNSLVNRLELNEGKIMNIDFEYDTTLFADELEEMNRKIERLRE